MWTNINLELSEFFKNRKFAQNFKVSIMKRLEGNYIAIYTDGSKGDAGKGAEAVCQQIIKATRLPIETSNFPESCMQ